MNSKKLIVIILLAIIAFINATYLSYHAFLIDFTTSLTSSSFCDISNKFSCSNVLVSPESKFFWYPFTMVSMIVYPIILLIALLWYFGKVRIPFNILAYTWLFWTIFNSYYIFKEAFYIGSFCPLCLMCFGIIITIFILSLSELKSKK